MNHPLSPSRHSGRSAAETRNRAARGSATLSRTRLVDTFRLRFAAAPTRLVWFERHAWVVEAITREKRIKGWKRDWKLKLIEDANPQWLDLAADWFSENDPDWVSPVEED